MSKVTIYYEPSAAERLGVNIGNMARYAAKNTAISFVQGGLYAGVLGTLPEILSNDDQLSIDGRKSPYDTAAGDVVRNLLVLSTQDDAVSLVFVDININVAQENEVKKTPLLKRSGSIKEFIQAKDYVVNVKGSLMSSSPGAFPYDMLQSLARLLKTPETLKVANKYLEAFDIYNVVVERVDFKQQEQKYMNVLPFTIKLISDENYELEVE